MAEKRLDLVIDPTKAEQGGKRVKKVLVDLQKDAKVLVKSFKDVNAAIGNSKKILDVVTKLEKQIQKTGDTTTKTGQAVSSYDEAVKKATSAVQKNYDTLQLLNTETGKELVLTQQMVRERKNSIKTVSAEAKAIDELNKEHTETQGKLSALQKGYGQHNAKVKQSVKLHDDLAKAQEKLKLTQTDQYKELQRVNAEIDKQKRAVNDTIGVHDRATNSARNFERSLMGVGIAASMISGTEMLGQLVQTLDKYTELQNKIAVVTGSTDDLSETTRELLEVSLVTRTSLEATTDLYSKLTRVNERFGMSQQEVLSITTTVSQAVAMSGASAAAAEGAVIQFAQALAGDFKTAGQELNSILEQTPGLAQTIAAGLTKLGTQGDVTASQLKKLASEGLLSTEQVLQGLQAASGETAEAFKKSSKTISQAQEGLNQAFIVTAGEIDKTVGVSKSLVSSLEDMTKIISTNKEAVAALAGAFTGLASTAILGTAVALAGLISAPWLAAAAGITAVAAALSVSAFRTAEIEQAANNAAEGVVTLTEKLEELRNTSSEEINPFQFVDISFGVEQEINDLKAQIEEVKKLRQNYTGQIVSGYVDVSQTNEQSEEVKNLNDQLSSLRSQLELLENKRGVLNDLFEGGLGGVDKKSPLGLLEESLENLITKKDPLEKTKKEIEEINEQIDRYKKLLKEAGKDPLIDPVAVELLQKLEQIKLDKMAAALSKSKANLVDWDKTLRGVTKDLQGQVETFGMTERAMALHTNAKQAEIKVEKAYEKQLEKGLITQKEVDKKKEQAVEQTVVLTNSLYDLKDALKESNKEASNIADISNLFNKAGDSVTKFTLTSKELDVFKDKALDMLDGTKVGLERYQETIERLNNIEVKNPLDDLLFDINATDLEKQLKPLEDTLDVLRSKLAMEDLSDDSKKNIREAMDEVETEIGKVKFDHIANSFEAGLSGLQKMSSEGSSAFQALGAAIDVVNGIQAINAVMTQGSGDPYTAFARMATMAGIVASMGYSVGGAFSGGSDGSARAQEVQGTGTVLGDTSAKSESILKSSEITAEATSELVGINRSMLDALNNLQAGISGAVTMIARGSSGIDLPTGSTPTGTANTLIDIASVASPLVTIADTFLGDKLSDLVAKSIGAKVKGKDSGIRIIGGALDDLMDSTITEAFSKWRQRSSFFSSYKNKEVTEALDDSVNRQFSLVFEGINDSVKSGAEVLKISSDEIQSALNNFIVETTDISLKGLDPEEQQAELQAVFSTIFDNLAEDVVPFIDDFQRAGEALGETLARVASNVTLTEHSVNKLNIALPVSSETLSHFSTSLIDASGGFEGFSSNVSDFVNGFKTESEQLVIQTEDLIDAFGNIGHELPSTKEGFVSLIESLTDPSDIANVLALSEATDNFFENIEGLEKSFRSGFYSNMENLTKVVEDSSDELDKFSHLGISTSSSLSDVRTQVENFMASSLFTPEGYSELLSAAHAWSEWNKATEELNKVSKDNLKDVQSVIDSVRQALDPEGFEQQQFDDVLSKLGLTEDNYQMFLQNINNGVIGSQQLLVLAQNLNLEVDEFAELMGVISKSVSNIAGPADTSVWEAIEEFISDAAEGFDTSDFDKALNALGITFGGVEEFIDKVSSVTSVKGFQDLFDINLSGLTSGDALEFTKEVIEGFGELKNQALSIVDDIQSSLNTEEFNTLKLTEALDLLNISLEEAEGFLLGLDQQSILDLATTLGVSLDDISEAVSTVTDELTKDLEELEEATKDYSKIATDALTGLRKSISAEKEALKESTDKLLDSYNSQITTVTNSVKELEDLTNDLHKALLGTRIESQTLDRVRRESARGQLTAALVAAQSGQLPTDGSLDRTLSELQKPAVKFYTDFNTYARDQASVTSDLISLDELTGDQLSVEKQTLMSLEELIKETERGYELEVQKLDEILESYEREILELQGVNTSVLSVEEAVRAVEQAILDLNLSQQKQVVSSVSTVSGGGTATTVTYDTGHIKKIDEFGHGQTNMSGSVTDASISSTPSTGMSFEEATSIIKQSVTTGVNADDLQAASASLGVTSFADIQKIVDGNFRTGVVVPRDNFLMNAHEGERLLSAQENRIYSGMIESGANETALLRQEVSQMRREMNIMLTSINQHSSSTANNTDTLRRWERNPGSQTVTTQ